MNSIEASCAQVPNGNNNGSSPTPTSAPPAPPVVDYQAIFEDAFVQAYGHYAQFFYTKAFYSNKMPLFKHSPSRM